MKETAGLIEKSKRFLKSAQLLVEDGDYESAVSRTYYAMFFCAEAALLTKNLNRAFEKRQVGDCEYTFVISEEEAEKLLQSGSDFVNNITNWLDSNS